MSTVGIIGPGSWGTALAVSLARSGHSVRIYGRNREHLEALKAERENKKYLKGVKFPETMNAVDSVKETIEGADAVLFAVPAQGFRATLESAREYITDDMIIINVAKGIERKTLLRLSEIAAEFGIEKNYCVLSGPSHAEEVGIDLPTTIVAAAEDKNVAVEVQKLFSTEFLRVYTGTDVIGAELGGALKNIIALGAGISDGIGLGDNAKAALMTRGIAEMKRLGTAIGAEEATFAGLTGIGDLIVTCTSMHSRNRRCGILMGQGKSPEEAIAEVGMVVEGMFTAEAAYELAKKVGVEMPITNAIYHLVNGEVEVKAGIRALMTRDLKPED